MKKYDFAKKTIEYKHRVAGDAAVGSSNIQPAGGPFGDVISGIGNVVLSGRVADKLRRSAKPEVMAESISEAMREATSSYLQLALGHSASSDFIFETDLTEYRLMCSSGGIQIEAEAYCRLLERKTGRIVWDDCESKTVYMTRSGVPAARAGVGTVMGAISCAELLEMSDNEVTMGLERAAKEVAYQLTETLREDVAEMHEQ